MRTQPGKKQCRKVRYGSKKAARQALKSYGKDRGALRYYRCGFHPGEEVYHLTSERR